MVHSMRASEGDRERMWSGGSRHRQDMFRPPGWALDRNEELSSYRHLLLAEAHLTPKTDSIDRPDFATQPEITYETHH